MIKFQSHIGAIRILTDSQPALHLSGDFNPTLVQLELAQQLDATLTASVFQSHIGAIRI